MIEMTKETFAELMRAVRLAAERGEGEVASFTEKVERAVKLSGMGGESTRVRVSKDFPCTEKQSSFVSYGEGGLTVGIIDHEHGGWHLHT